MTTRRALVIVCAAAIALAAGSGVGSAESNNCGRLGTWFGQSDSGITWMAIETRGESATVGQFELDWIVIDPTLGGVFPSVVRATGAKGVWEKVNKSTYKYTWVAYGLGADGQPVFAARTSGTETMAGCDRFDIGYTLELFLPSQNMWADAPLAAFSGTAVEKRMPLAVVVP